jgi:zinc finger CCHC domain-containing protein 8
VIEVGSAEDDESKQKVVKIDYGTPIFDSVTPFSKLPTNEQFSKGVSDVINFENLPDSTGKYEKMRSLITKVRECVAKINSEV